MLLVILTALATQTEPRLIDANVATRTFLFDDVTHRPNNDQVPDSEIPACAKTGIGDHGEDFIVVRFKAPGGTADVDTIPIAEFNMKEPCQTKAGAAKARADAKKELAAQGLDPDRKAVTGLRLKGADGVDAYIPSEDAMYATLEHRVIVGGAVVYKSSTEFSKGMAGNETITSAFFDDHGGVVELEIVNQSNMRGGSIAYQLVGPLSATANGVDVAGLKAVKLSAACAPSLASNAALVDSVALTMSYALGAKDSAAPVSKAKAERATSVVYASAPCTDAAKALAAKVPGGATVEPLTWKSTGGIVIALGATAAPK